jgi:hypothetical protein
LTALQSPLPDSIAAIRIVAPSFEECVGGGGCIAGDPTEPYCKAPCDQPSSVAPPDPPLPVDMRPCALGWSEIELEGGGFECVPPTRVVCPEGAVQFAGDASCTVLGEACARRAWPDDLPARGVVYVQPGAVGGDGSAAAPLGRISLALSSTTAPIIALSPGDHPADLQVQRSVSIRGACISTTRLVGRVTFHGGTDDELSGLTIAPVRAGGPIVAVRSGAVVAAERVRIEDSGCGNRACVAVDGELSLSTSVLQIRGSAISVTGTAALDGVVLERSTRAIYVDDGRLAAQRIAIRSSTTSLEFASGTATISASVIETYRGPAIEVHGGAIVGMAAVAIRDAVPSPKPFGAIFVHDGAVVSLIRSSITRYLDAGLAIGFPAPAPPLERFHVRDVLIRDGRPSPQAPSSYGIYSHALFTAERLRVEADRDRGIWLSGADSTLLDVAILDIAECTASGASFVVRGGATSIVNRLFVRGGKYAGVFVGDGGTLSATNLEIDGARVGMRLQYSAESPGDPVVHLAKASIRGSRQVGLQVTRGNLVATDLQISDTLGLEDEPCRENSGEYGVSLTAELLTTLQLERFSLSGARTGISAKQRGGFKANDGRIFDHELGLLAAKELDLSQIVRVVFANTDDLEQN